MPYDIYIILMDLFTSMKGKVSEKTGSFNILAKVLWLLAKPKRIITITASKRIKKIIHPNEIVIYAFNGQT